MPDCQILLKAEGLRKDFFRQGQGTNVFTAVRETSLLLAAGEFVLLKGRSGSGKTTLLNMLAGLLTPDAGRVLLYTGETAEKRGTDAVPDAQMTDLYTLDDEARSRLRGRMTGYIPQGAGALGSLTMLENILLPYTICGDAFPDNTELETLLDALGIAALKDAFPAALSGGELRRMALARALIRKPALVFADEPTADLDDENTRVVLSLLQQAARDGAAVLVATHEPEADAYADRVLQMT